jgi:hypothetical protein
MEINEEIKAARDIIQVLKTVLTGLKIFFTTKMN